MNTIWQVLLNTSTSFVIAICTYQLLITRLISTKLLDYVPKVSWLGLAWLIGLELRGIIASWCYYLDVSSHNAMIITYVVACGLLLWLRPSFDFIKAFKQEESKSPTPLSLKILVCLIFGFYIMRCLIPWQDHDEIAVYAFISKLIADQWTVSKIISITPEHMHGASKFLQSIDAQFFYLGDQTFFVRLTRVFNLIAVYFLAHGILSCLGLKNKHATWVCLAFITLPELALLGTSLKLDSTVMVFELGALLLLLLSIYPSTALKGFQKWQLSMLAFMLAVGSYAIRQSGIYIFALTFCISLYQLLKLETPWSKKLAWIGGLGIFANLVLVSVWFHIVYYGNPFYPFHGPGFLKMGDSLRDLELFRSYYNVDLPHVVKQLYLLFHQTFGIEWLYVRFGLPIDFLPMAAHKQISLSWPYPFYATIVFLPLLWKVKLCRYAMILFIAQYLIWCEGIHYSRVFMASSCLIILAAIYYIGVTPFQKGALYHALKIFCITATVAGVAFHMNRTVKPPSQIKHVYSPFSYNKLKALETFVQRDYAASIVPSQEDVDFINKFLVSEHFPVITSDTSIGRVAHMFFKRGFFLDKGTVGPAKYILHEQGQSLSDEKIKLVYQSRDGRWSLYQKL